MTGKLTKVGPKWKLGRERRRWEKDSKAR